MNNRTRTDDTQPQAEAVRRERPVMSFHLFVILLVLQSTAAEQSVTAPSRRLHCTHLLGCLHALHSYSPCCLQLPQPVQCVCSLLPSVRQLTHVHVSMPMSA